MRPTRARALATTAVVAAVAVLGGILLVRAALDGATSTPTTPASSQQPTGTVTVSAAASLTDVMPVIAADFQKRFPGTRVQFNFGGSSQLVEQVNSGAPVDVLVTASEPTMSNAVSAGTVDTPVPIATNSMAIAMPPGNPGRVTSLADLQRPSVTTAVCTASVPCGAAAKDLLALNGVTISPVTQELDVRAVLGKVIADEVDAGIVYLTDVRAAGDKVTSVSIPADRNVTTTYPIAQVVHAPNPATAAAFVDYVRTDPSARGILRAYGFAAP